MSEYTKIQFRRDNGSPGTILDEGEPGFDKQNNKVYIGKGVGQQPIELAKKTDIPIVPAIPNFKTVNGQSIIGEGNIETTAPTNEQVSNAVNDYLEQNPVQATPVVDNLNSDSTTNALSAKQGKMLKERLDGKVVDLVPGTDYSIIIGNLNYDGSIGTGTSAWRSSPILFKAGETLTMVTQYQGIDHAVLYTDSEGSYYTPFIRANSTKTYTHTFPRDTYVSVYYLTSNPTTPRALTTFTRTIPAVKDGITREVVTLINDNEKLVQNFDDSLNTVIDNFYDVEERAAFKQALFEREEMKYEVSRKSADDILAQGDCGYFENPDGSIIHGTIKWKLYNNGILYIHGYGKMYDFLKGANGCRTVAQTNAQVVNLGESMWYYGFFEDNENGYTAPFGKSKQIHGGQLMVYSGKRYFPQEYGDAINPLNNLPYGYASPWYIYRMDIDAGYDGPATYNSRNPNGYKYNRICIDEDLTNGGITYIGNWAFYRITAKSLVLPSKVKKVGAWGVRYSPVLETLIFGNEITHMEDHACSRNEALKYVSISNSLVQTSFSTFESNPMLKKIKFPNTFVSAGDLILNGCDALERVDFGGLTVIPNRALVSAGNLTKLTLSNNLVAIGEASLYRVKLKEIKIPSTVTTINSGAFGLVEKLEKVIIESQTIANSITSSTAAGYLCNKAKNIYVTAGFTVGKYIRDNFIKFKTENNYDVYIKR